MSRDNWPLAVVFYKQIKAELSGARDERDKMLKDLTTPIENLKLLNERIRGLKRNRAMLKAIINEAYAEFAEDL